MNLIEYTNNVKKMHYHSNHKLLYMLILLIFYCNYLNIIIYNFLLIYDLNTLQ